MIEGIVLRAQREIMEAENNRREEGFGYDLTHVIRENLMWLSGLSFAEAQKIAQTISDQIYFANWLSVAQSDGKWSTFKR